MNGYKIQFKSNRDAVMAAFGITWEKKQKSEIFKFPSGARLFANDELPFVNTLLFTIMEPSSYQNPPGGTIDQMQQAYNEAVIEALKYTIHVVSTKDYFKEVQFRVMTNYSNY